MLCDGRGFASCARCKGWALPPDFDLHLIVDNSAVVSRYGSARGPLNNSAILK